tara:strand:+ start:2569 stop:2937 length:369 start_codon:yes stop_codon:yes gene_type:complete
MIGTSDLNKLIDILKIKGYKLETELVDLETINNWLMNDHQIFIEIKVDKTTYPKYCYTISRFHGNPKNLSEKVWYWETELEYDCRKNFKLEDTHKEAFNSSILESLKLINDYDKQSVTNIFG